MVQGDDLRRSGSLIFQSNARFHGFAPSFALLGEPETNGVVERFHRTLKEQTKGHIALLIM
jgi:transposase InsO family protein